MRRGRILIWSVVIELTLIAGLQTFFSLIDFAKGGLIVTLVLAAVLLFCLAYFWWAPNNLFFTFVPEGRAKIVVRGDAFQKVLIQWRKHIIGTDLSGAIGQTYDVGDVIEGTSSRGPGWFRKIFGGLRYYGFWPVKDIYLYDFTWTGLDPNGEPRRHEKETLDFILLKEDVYFVEIKDAEDKNLLPLNVALILPIRVINPYKALFCVQNWLETVIGMIAPAVRDRITEETYKEWITSARDLGQEIFDDLRKNGVIQKFEAEYGVEVKATQVREIDPGEEFRKASLQEYLAKREADRIKIVYEAIKDQGDLGKLVRLIEGIEKGPGNWVIPLPPDLAKILSSVDSGKKAGG